jgi:hypothetical protein
MPMGTGTYGSKVGRPKKKPGASGPRKGRRPSPEKKKRRRSNA